jgi:hypothetical protein
VAAREGVFAIAPPTVTWNGRKVQANALRVTVHPAGSPGAHGRQPPTAPSPFDPFGMFPKLPGLFDTPQPDATSEPPPDPELSLDAPLDAKVFLRSVVDQKNPVVGEQVTLTVYVYARSGSIELTDPHEPSIPDFFRRDLMTPNTQPDPRSVSIGGVPWRAQAIFKAALFPLKAGELEIGPMQATIVGGRGSGLTGVIRASQPVQIHATEPPAKGRPVGYQIGDVGNYSLSATVEPRSAEVGGAVAITVTLSGVGNVPNAVRIPQSSSVEWLEPQTRENIEIENGKVRGSRTFSYVVRPKTTGTVDLGEITLPYYNPDRKVYDIARAWLGKAQIAPDKAQAMPKEPTVPHDPWSSLGQARGELGAYARARDPLTEKPFYWFSLFGAPFAVVAGSLGSRGFRRLRLRLATRHTSPERGIERALADARQASKKDERSIVASSLDRAVYLAIERATGLKARALLLQDIPAALESRQVATELATDVRELLSSIENVRFAVDATPSAAELVARAERTVSRLGRLSLAEKD